jgi:hypothetical protein
MSGLALKALASKQNNCCNSQMRRVGGKHLCTTAHSDSHYSQLLPITLQGNTMMGGGMEGGGGGGAAPGFDLCSHLSLIDTFFTQL